MTFLDNDTASAWPPQIHRRVVRIRRSVTVQPELDSDAKAYFNALCGRWGLRSHHYRASMFRRRQAASLRAVRVATPRDAMRAILSDGAASERALGAVMIGVTSFFRDPEVFAALREPLLALHKRRGPLEVISVGCSNGSELYTVAMLMADAEILSDSRLTGVDCRPNALVTAKEGLYPAGAASAIDPIAREAHTERCTEPTRLARSLGQRRARATAIRVSRQLRDACRWELADAFAWPATLPPAADVVLCRNLAIYLTPTAAEALWSLLFSKLAPGGLLVVGKAERPSATVRSRCARLTPCIYRRIGSE